MKYEREISKTRLLEDPGRLPRDYYVRTLFNEPQKFEFTQI